MRLRSEIRCPRFTRLTTVSRLTKSNLSDLQTWFLRTSDRSTKAWWHHQRSLSELIINSTNTFKRNSPQFTACDAFIPPINFIGYLNRCFEDFAGVLNKFVFMYDNIIEERLDAIKKLAFDDLAKDTSSVHDLLTNVEQKRSHTKEMQEVFITICEDLMHLNTESLHPESKITKDTIQAKKNQKKNQELVYRQFYVISQDELSRYVYQVYKAVFRAL